MECEQRKWGVNKQMYKYGYLIDLKRKYMYDIIFIIKI